MRPQTFTHVPSTRKPLSLKLRLQAGADEPRPNVCEVQKNHPNPAQPCANSSKSCIKRAKPHHTFRVRHVTHNTFLIIVLDAADHLDAEFDPVEWEKTSSLAVSA